MTKINFTSYPTPDSTHLVSDGTESMWLTWPGKVGEGVCEQYEEGYDHNGSAADVQAVIYDMDGDAVMSWTF